LKYSKGRKPDKELLAKVKLYLVDPAKMMKDDKTVKAARTRFLKKGMKKKPEESLFSNDVSDLLHNDLGMNVTIGEDGLPVE